MPLRLPIACQPAGRQGRQAPVVKWISHQSSELTFKVRILAGAQMEWSKIYAPAKGRGRETVVFHGGRQAVFRPLENRGFPSERGALVPGIQSCSSIAPNAKRPEASSVTTLTTLSIYSVRVPGIEPGSFDWQPNVLPLNHTRFAFS